MSALPNCPKCNSEYTYEDGSMLVCPMCAHEWSPAAEAEAATETAPETPAASETDAPAAPSDAQVQ